MPTPLTTPLISNGPEDALRAICDGNTKIPLPFIDPTVSTARASNASPTEEPVREEGGTAAVFRVGLSR
jgi:hypothetical protein